MGIETGTAILIASLAATAIGAGVTAYSQHQAGKTQEAIAAFNAHQQAKQAETNRLQMELTAATQQQQAQANFLLRQQEAAAHYNNAKSLENRALGQDAINRENLIKRRQEFAEMQASQRASLAAAGVSESSGTPLDLLAETAMRIQQDQEEQHYGNEMKRRTLFAEADQERLGGRLAAAGATLDRDSQVTGAALKEAAGRSEYLAGMRQAELTRLTGKAAAQAGDLNAVATLFSSHAEAGKTYLQYAAA